MAYLQSEHFATCTGQFMAQRTIFSAIQWFVIFSLIEQQQPQKEEER